MVVGIRLLLTRAGHASASTAETAFEFFGREGGACSALWVLDPEFLREGLGLELLGLRAGERLVLLVRALVWDMRRPRDSEGLRVLEVLRDRVGTDKLTGRVGPGLLKMYIDDERKECNEVNQK